VWINGEQVGIRFLKGATDRPAKSA